MDELYYTAFDIAVMIYDAQLGLRATTELINAIWDHEHMLLAPDYQKDKYRFVNEIYFWLNDRCDMQQSYQDYLEVQSDFQELNLTGLEDKFTQVFKKDPFLKSLRIRILYIDKKSIAIKFNKLLWKYRYRKFTPEFETYMKNCIDFYRLKLYVKGRMKYDLKGLSENDNLSFSAYESSL